MPPVLALVLTALFAVVLLTGVVWWALLAVNVLSARSRRPARSPNGRSTSASARRPA